MGRLDGILLCTDLDGTLLRKDKSVSEENIKAIEFFMREGGLFTFITGRMPFYSSDIYSTVKPNAPIGCVNGGGIYDYTEQKYIWKSTMPDGVFELVRLIDEGFSEVGVQVSTFYKSYFTKDNETMIRFRRTTGLPNLVCGYDEIKEPIAKIIFGSEYDGEISEIEKTLKAHPLAEKFDFIRSSKTLFEILPKGIAKGLAIEKLAEHLGIDRNNTVAIGDYNNDISMFRAANIGIAVANACKEALEAADIITVSNEENAVAKVIYDLYDGVIKL